MWPFIKKQSHFTLDDIAPHTLFDTHCHILYGLDDGPTTLEASKTIYQAMRQMGYKKVAATPHHHHRLFPTPRKTTILKRIKEIVPQSNSLEILPSGEVMFNSRFLTDVQTNTLPTLGKSSAYLVEFPSQPGGIPAGFENAVFELQTKEVTLILAHFERYPHYYKKDDQLKLLRKAGALTQVNILSIAGKYGRTIRKAAWQLLETHNVDILASDLHNVSDIELLEKGLSILKKWNKNELIRLASTNPGLLLEGNPWEIEQRA